MRRYFVVTIDTEEEGLWSGRYRAVGNRCRNVEELPRLAARFARFGVRATYLIDYPVAVDQRACAILRELAAGGRAEMGAHLHPWCTPPLLPGGTRARATFAHRLGRDVQRRKIAALRDAIVVGIGVTPTAYRAGRWGFDASTVPVLEELGFVVDSSVRPLWWDPSRGGPSFVRAPTAPYRLSPHDACAPGWSGVLEVPVSHAVVGHGPAWERVARLVPPLPGLRRVMRRLGSRALTPEDHSLGELCAVADELYARGVPLVNVAFHSSVLLPGGTPFARDTGDVERFLDKLDGLVRHLVERHRAAPLTLSEVPQRLAT